MSYGGPRRAPLTGEQRERNATGALGARVAGGATGSAKRVPAGGTGASIFQPPSGVGTDRISVYVEIPLADLSGSFHSVDEWTGISDLVGGSLALADPDDGQVYVLVDGVYSVNTLLGVANMAVADPAFEMAALTTGPGHVLTVCRVAGTQAGANNGGIVPSASASYTYFATGGFGNGWLVSLKWKNLDVTAADPVWVYLDIQQISAAG